jgi:hypothetical protein
MASIYAGYHRDERIARFLRRRRRRAEWTDDTELEEPRLAIPTQNASSEVWKSKESSSERRYFIGKICE